jgi:hypothetical protein
MPGWPVTVATLIVALTAGALANWQLRRPFDRRWLKLAPWTGIQFVAAVIVVVMLAHALSLATGRPFGRGY